MSFVSWDFCRAVFGGYPPPGRRQWQWISKGEQRNERRAKGGIERTETMQTKRINYQQRKRTQRIRRFVFSKDCGFRVSSQRYQACSTTSTQWHAAHLPRSFASIIEPGIPRAQSKTLDCESFEKKAQDAAGALIEASPQRKGLEDVYA